MTNDSKEPFTVQEWINWKNGDYVPPDAEWQYREVEPEVTKKSLWIDENYEWWWYKNNDDSTGAIQELIITLTDGKPSIRWADVDDT